MKWRTLWGSNDAYFGGLPFLRVGRLGLHVYKGGAFGFRNDEIAWVFDIGPLAIRWRRD